MLRQAFFSKPLDEQYSPLSLDRSYKQQPSVSDLLTNVFVVVPRLLCHAAIRRPFIANYYPEGRLH